MLKMENNQHCEICHSPVSKYHRLNNIDLFRCSNCYFIFSDRNSNVNFDYQTAFYADIAEHSKRVHEFYAGARIELIRKYKRNIHSLLDVGCSSGIFLNKINSQIKRIKGIELSQKAVERARGKGLNVELKNIFDENEKFDVITLIEVIEHFKDINLLIKKLYDLLNSYGMIYFQTGNSSSLEFWLKGKKWQYFDPPSHCSYFGKKSITILLKNHNFKILYLGSDINFWTYLMTNNKPYSSISVLKGMIGKFQFNGYTIPSSVGVIAQKVS
jgi:SAM-dependent methyltransferase